MQTIRVVTEQPADSYEIIIGAGALKDAASLIGAVAPAHRYALIADSTVAALHGGAVHAALSSANLSVDLLEFPAGEPNKTRDTWHQLTDALLDRRFGRDSCVIALGGGVTGDLAGFVASTFMRGIPLIQLPTTLLAMVDAAIGGKTGVDTTHGKNLVGAFHNPRLVLSDPEVLATLPEQELRSGLAECVKHGAIADAAYLDWIDEAAAPILSRDARTLEQLVHRSAEIKTSFVNQDPYEAGPRKSLNFGHTVGHAVETLASYEIPHGYAVAIGMVAEARIGETLGVTAAGTAERVTGSLRALGLPIGLPPEFGLADLADRMALDKKARAARIEVTLLARAGEVARGERGGWTHVVRGETLRAALS